MKDRKSKKKSGSFQKIWLRLSILTVTVALVPILILGLFFYGGSAIKEKETFYTSTTSQLQNISRTLQQNFVMVGNDIQLMLSQEQFVTYKRMTKPGEHVENIRSINNRLAEVCLKYPFATSAYFYHPDTDSLITNYSGTYSAATFYDTEWITDAPSLYSTLQTDLRMNANRAYLLDPQKKSLLVVKPEPVITMAGTGFNSSRVAINISVAELHSWIEEIYPMQDSQFFIVDPQGNIVAAKNSRLVGDTLGHNLLEAKQDILRQDGQIYFLQRINNQLYGVMVFPNGAASAYTKQLSTFIVFLTILLSIVLGLFSIYMTKQIYSPVRELSASIQQLSRHKGVQSEHQIEDEIENIITLYHDIEQSRVLATTTLSSYQQSLFAYQFRDYLLGYSSFDELIGDIGPGALPVAGKHYQFIVYHTTKAETLYASASNSIDVINSYIHESGQGLFLELELGIYCALISNDSPQELALVGTIVTRLLRELLELPLSLGDSPVFTNATLLAEMFQIARRSSEHAFFFGIPPNHATTFAPSEEPKESYQFLINFETRIIKSILCGEREQVPKIISELGHLVRERSLSISLARGVYLRLVTTLSQELEIGANLGLANEIYRADTLAEIQQHVEKYTTGISDTIEHEKEHFSIYTEQAKAILEKDYSRDLSVLELAEEIGISYPYLSKLFKDDTGVSLLEHLHQVRIDKSKKLLAESNENIMSIGEQVGYNNPQSFQRYFKRIVGVTPGAYRKMQQKKD